MTSSAVALWMTICTESTSSVRHLDLTASVVCYAGLLQDTAANYSRLHLKRGLQGRALLVKPESVALEI